MSHRGLQVKDCAPNPDGLLLLSAGEDDALPGAVYAGGAPESVGSPGSGPGHSLGGLEESPRESIPGGELPTLAPPSSLGSPEVGLHCP